MDTLQRGIITLMRSGLTGEKLPLPVEFDLEQACPQMVRHQIQPICYLGAVQCGVDKKLPVMQRLFQGYCRCLQHSEGQTQAIERVCAALDGAGVDYMPLKGCNLKALYPKPELRLMGDADVLIRTEQYDKIRPLMLELGMEEQVESDHELVWHSKLLHLELHKRLIPSYNKDYYRYFGDGWRLAKLQQGTRYHMTPEDEYIYLFTHFAKHYRDGGIGCRHAADLWVYRRAHQLDEAYLSAELAKLRLLEFERNIQNLLRVWFEGAEENEKTAFITDFIFQSGSWGGHEAHVVSRESKQVQIAGSVVGGKIRRALAMLFPPMLVMGQKYPILQKCPILLPFLWPVRWITALFFRRDNIRRQRDDLMAVTPDKIETYQQALHYVGLDFHFKE